MAIAKWRDKKSGGKITNENIANVIAYNTKSEKTLGQSLVYCHECDFIYNGLDFQEATADREIYNHNEKIDTLYDEFYVSYGTEIVPEYAFELLKEIAHKYLGDEYQYIVAAHADAEHTHGHILFNCSNLVTHKMFNSSTKHRIDDLRNIVNEVSIEHGLSTEDIRKHKDKNDRLERGEYYARMAARSYKEKARIAIDMIIENADSYEDFMRQLNEVVEVDTSGKYTKIKLPEAERPMRLQSLGSNYYDETILYRIEHKAEPAIKKSRLKYIDTSSDKFQNSPGLQHWANKQNIDIAADRVRAIQEIRKRTKDKTLQAQIDELNESIREKEEALKELNSEIKELREIGPTAVDEYRKLYRELIEPYKQIKDQKKREAYKSSHYQEFKKYDRCTKLLKKYRGEDKKLPNSETMAAIADQKQQEYFELYPEIQDMNGEREYLKTLNTLYRELREQDPNFK